MRNNMNVFFVIGEDIVTPPADWDDPAWHHP